MKLEDPLHGELVVEDAMKRIEKKRAKQERKAQFNAGNTWSANPYEEKSEVESEEEKEDAAIPAVKEIPATDADVWRAKPEKTTGVSSKVNQNSLLTDRTDSKILHAKLVKVQTLLLDSRRNMLLSGASFAGGLILIAIEGYAFAAISFIAIPVFAVIAVVKKHNAIRALSSVQ